MQDERLQASEKTWGAVVQALKGIAQRRGWMHRGHHYILETGHQIGLEFGNVDITAATFRANQLHENFYENAHDAQVIGQTLDLVEAVIPALEDIRDAAPRPFTIANTPDRDRMRMLTGDRSLQVGDVSPVGFSLNHPLAGG